MIAIFLMFFNVGCTSDCIHDKTTFRSVEYVKNCDTDTITFNFKNVHPINGQSISVRISHIDTPEIKSSSAYENIAARADQRLVDSLLKNAKCINLVNGEKDKDFRLLADVIINGKNLTDLFHENRLAYGSEGGTKTIC